MKINDIITETINLSQYKNQIGNIILISANITVKELIVYLRKFTALTDDNFSKTIRDFVKLRYRVNIEENMTTFISQFTKSYFDKHSNVTQKTRTYFLGGFEFDDIKDRGLTYPYNIIVINESYYEKISDQLVMYLIDYLINNISTSLEDMKTKLNEYVANFYENNWNVRTYSKLVGYPVDLISVIIHELTHVSQQLRHQVSDKLNPMRPSYNYRSYLAKTKQDFYASFAKDSNGNYINSELFMKLHAASPQEIAAHAHDQAIGLISDLGIENATTVKDIDDTIKNNTDYIVGEVKAFLKERGIVPQTKTEFNIYRRYLKLLYMEIENYKNYLKSNLDRK